MQAQRQRPTVSVTAGVRASFASMYMRLATIGCDYTMLNRHRCFRHVGACIWLLAINQPASAEAQPDRRLSALSARQRDCASLLKALKPPIDSLAEARRLRWEVAPRWLDNNFSSLYSALDSALA